MLIIKEGEAISNELRSSINEVHEFPLPLIPDKTLRLINVSGFKIPGF